MFHMDTDAHDYFIRTTYATADEARADEYEGPDEPCSADYDEWARKF